MHRSGISLFSFATTFLMALKLGIMTVRSISTTRWRARRVRGHKVTYFFTFHMIDVVVPRDVNKYVNRCLKCNAVKHG